MSLGESHQPHSPIAAHLALCAGEVLVLLLWQDKEHLSSLLNKANHRAAEHLCELQTHLVTNGIPKLTFPVRESFVLHCWIEVERKEREVFYSHSAADDGRGKSEHQSLVHSNNKWWTVAPWYPSGELRLLGFHRGLSQPEILSFAVQTGFCESSATVAAGVVTMQECWFSLYSSVMNE